jgi:hypothetical protein
MTSSFRSIGVRTLSFKAFRITMVVVAAALAHAMPAQADGQADPELPLAARGHVGTWLAAPPVTREGDIPGVAAALSQQATAEVEQRLRTLFRKGGTSLYLTINSHNPLEVRLRPVPGERFHMATAGRESSHVRGALSSTVTPSANRVLSFVLHGTTLPVYVIDAPPGLSYLTLVVNGRVAVAELPIDHGDALATIFAN